MTTFKVTERQCPEYGRTFPEYTKFARQVGIVTWVPLLVGENRVKKFALCNLEEVVSARMALQYEVEFAALELEETIQEIRDEFIVQANDNQLKRMMSREIYSRTLELRINDALTEPPPMVIFPMPDMFPQDVFLGIANGLLELAKRAVDIRLAVAEGQLPSERKAA